jgi:hypothetical protein
VLIQGEGRNGCCVRDTGPDRRTYLPVLFGFFIIIMPCQIRNGKNWKIKGCKEGKKRKFYGRWKELLSFHHCITGEEHRAWMIADGEKIAGFFPGNLSPF